MNNSPWQPPPDGVPEEVRVAFWERVNRTPDGKHWVWMGLRNANIPALMVKARYVTATRIAFALTHPGEQVPSKLKRREECPNMMCVNPACFSGWGTRVHGENTIGGVTIPPMIAALAHVQLGMDVVPVPRRFRSTHGLSAEEAGAPPVKQERSLAKPPEFVAPYGNSLPGGLTEHVAVVDMSASIDAEAVLSALLQPGTSTVVYPSGSVWIFGPRGVRINEATADVALRRFAAVHQRGME